MKITWKTLPLDHPEVVAHVTEKLAEDCGGGGCVHLDEKSRFGGRRHLKLHRDAKGQLYVRQGRRGSSKNVLGRCKLTYFDGEATATLFQFTLKSMDEFEAEEQRRFNEKYGITD